MVERSAPDGHIGSGVKDPIDSLAATPSTRASERLVLREWSVSYAYSSFYIGDIEDLDVVAEALVRSRVVTSAYVADGSLYWLKEDELRKEKADLRWREHELHAHIRLPKDVDGWPAIGMGHALLQRFSEKKVVSPLPGPQHEYIRAAMEPSVLGFGDERIIVCPTLKLYRTGVFVISYQLMTPEEGIGVDKLIAKYVNLFARWCDEAWIPHAIARAGATTTLHQDNTDRKSRKNNLGMMELMRAAADAMAQKFKVDDLEFSLYPAHVSLDTLIKERLLDSKESDLPIAAASVALPAVVEASDIKGEVSHQAELGKNANDGGADDGGADDGGADDGGADDGGADDGGADDGGADDGGADDGGADESATQSYMLSDMFDNAEYAIRTAIDPPYEGKQYIRHGLRPRLTLGNFWQCRPQVSIEKFDHQPATASEIRDTFGEDLGRIMVRVPSAPPKLARAQLGDTLRPFEDHSLHINSTISLCVYASDKARKVRVYPAVLAPMERACTFEMIDYLAMRCHQLDQRAMLATSVAEARSVRTEIAALENLAGNAFRAGELNEATLAAWERLRLPIRVQEAREKVSLASEAAQERSGERATRFNVALTIVFGVVGAASLTDAVAKPVWAKLGLPFPEGLEGPCCFTVSAALVGLVIWLVARFNKK